MQTRTVTAHIPVELAQKIDDAAERMERPRGWIVKQALMNWVSLEERRHQMTLEALQEAADGKFIEHEEIRAWARSLK
ncbi:MAG: CopG family ribbon-helix-helix protein [Asticcacaulis sp.]